MCVSLIGVWICNDGTVVAGAGLPRRTSGLRDVLGLLSGGEEVQDRWRSVGGGVGVD